MHWAQNRKSLPESMTDKRGVLCVFTKAPVVGQVKTRLFPVLGPEKATDLYRTLLAKTLATACSSNISRVQLYCSPDTSHIELQNYSKTYELQLKTQTGKSLGEKMNHALEQGLCEFDYALVLGCDCPWLSIDDLNTAYRGLEQGSDAVLGPAKDGGYYLLGLTSPQPDLFNSMQWETSLVLKETRLRMRKARLDWFELNEYQDVDVPEDLAAYVQLMKDRFSAKR
ncbi:MAG: DUF2064 domain-containing protein [Gammaproteobacteria bacterium]|nr:DUF2064 domain-containing protein [Gammaproteobacteria bacterium]